NLILVLAGPMGLLNPGIEVDLSAHNRSPHLSTRTELATGSKLSSTNRACFRPFRSRSRTMTMSFWANKRFQLECHAPPAPVDVTAWNLRLIAASASHSPSQIS